MNPKCARCGRFYSELVGVCETCHARDVAEDRLALELRGLLEDAAAIGSWLGGDEDFKREETT